MFGPPGIGKSSIISTLKHVAGYITEDLERSYKGDDPTASVEARATELSTRPNVLLGGANLAASKARSLGYKTCLLYLPTKEYDERRATRDSKQPDKTVQPRHSANQWLRGFDWDFVLYADDHVRAKIRSIL